MKSLNAWPGNKDRQERGWSRLSAYRFMRALPLQPLFAVRFGTGGACCFCGLNTVRRVFAFILGRLAPLGCKKASASGGIPSHLRDINREKVFRKI